MQKFSNNASTALASSLAASATSMSVTSSAGFQSLTSPEYELVTLENNTSVEIVKVTARAGNNWTIERAQEGTTALLWPVGSRLEGRLTAGSAAGFVQAAGLSKAIGTGATAAATNGLALGANASAGGSYATALGSNASAAGQGGIAGGYAASAAGTDSTSLGANSDATHLYSVAIGSLAQATQERTIAVGYGAAASATDAIAIGSGAQASVGNTIAMGAEASAAGVDAVAIGLQATAALAATVVGSGAVVASQAVAIGRQSTANATAVAIGSGASAHGSRSIALNFDAFAARSVTARGFWSVPEDDWNDQYEHWSAGVMSVFATPYVDLAVPAAWQASTQYSHGQVVAPTTGGTVQYRAWCSYDDETLLHLTPTSGATEPTWPGAGGSVEINSTDNAEWIGTDLTDGYETEAVPDWLDFWPSEISFICHEYSSTTGTPTISVGTPSSPTLILNAASVGITAAGQVFHFTLPNPCPYIPEGESILVTLDGAASAGRMSGRFLFTGAFVATRSRT